MKRKKEIYQKSEAGKVRKDVFTDTGTSENDILAIFKAGSGVFNQF